MSSKITVKFTAEKSPDGSYNIKYGNGRMQQNIHNVTPSKKGSLATTKIYNLARQLESDLSLISISYDIENEYYLLTTKDGSKFEVEIDKPNYVHHKFNAKITPENRYIVTGADKKQQDQIFKTITDLHMHFYNHMSVQEVIGDGNGTYKYITNGGQEITRAEKRTKILDQSEQRSSITSLASIAASERSSLGALHIDDLADPRAKTPPREDKAARAPRRRTYMPAARPLEYIIPWSSRTISKESAAVTR